MEQEQDYSRYMKIYGAMWTPTLLVLDPDGIERHRIEGFLPAPDLMAQLTLGLGHAAFAREDWRRAEQWYERVLERFSKSEAAPEALYWAGVARYRGGDHDALADTAASFRKHYRDSSWAKKASVWDRTHATHAA